MVLIVVDHVLSNRPPPEILTLILHGLSGDRMTLLVFAVTGVFVIAVTNNALTVWNTYLMARVEQGTILKFRGEMFQHAQRLSFAFHDRQRTGSFMYRINYSSSAVGQVPMLVPQLLQALITLVGMFLIVWFIDRLLALIALSVVPALWMAIRYYARRIQPRLTEVREMEGRSLSIVHDAMTMLRVIAAFGREQHEHQRFVNQGSETVDARVRVTVRQTMFSLAINVITAGGTALVLGYGALLVLAGNLTVGALLVVMSYLRSVYSPLESIAGLATPVAEHLVQLKLAFGLLETPAEIVDAPDAVALGRARGEVEVRSVSFSYIGRAETLNDISFTVKAGQTVAIVGPTGAGKSTLVGLLPRFYDVAAGSVTVDGVDVRKIQLQSLRQQFAIVLQEPLLFSDTIMDNIRYGRLDASDEEVFEAARAANAHDFITRLPDGYQTALGERGQMLSGGERQRIAVARAFLRDAPILILDEPTSSIDSKTEQVILDALDRLVVGRTTFLIAHRLSTVRHADVILVINKGRIVERGTHDELLGQGGLYHEMHTVQSTRRSEPRAASASGNGGRGDRAQADDRRAAVDSLVRR
jgi:ATP-binding cassette subfamily B protein